MKCFRPNRDLLQSPRPDGSALHCATLAIGLIMVGGGVYAQTSKVFAQPGAYAAVKSYRIVQEKDGPAVEILSTKPMIPSIQALGDPPRLVIDLPNARLDTRRKRISIQADQISTLRADQFQENPPVARVVVDLLAPRAFTWAAAGNRLVVHLGKTPEDTRKTPFQPPSVVTLTPTPQPVAEVRTAGPLAVAGNSLASGSSITAGADTATLRLSRGGEVHVCPGTTVSVTPSQNGHNVMLGVNTGALETHFKLDSSSDSVITPDFRIVLPGPGEFDLAISTDSRGNTCVRALPGNTASAMVSELLGDRTYQVKATDQLVFRSGQIDRVDMEVPLECGCPPPRQPVLAAENRPVVIKDAEPARPRAASSAPNPDPPVAAVASPASDAQAAVPAGSSTPAELHVQVAAPFVFRATGPPPAPVEDARALPPDTRALPAPALTSPLPPSHGRKPAGIESASAEAAPRRGFFSKLRGFFAAMFR